MLSTAGASLCTVIARTTPQTTSTPNRLLNGSNHLELMAGPDLVKDKRNGLSHAPVRVFLVAITCLDEADRGRHHQFAAACLLVPGR